MRLWWPQLNLCGMGESWHSCSSPSIGLWAPSTPALSLSLSIYFFLALSISCYIFLSLSQSISLSYLSLPPIPLSLYCSPLSVYLFISRYISHPLPLFLYICLYLSHSLPSLSLSLSLSLFCFVLCFTSYSINDDSRSYWKKISQVRLLRLEWMITIEKDRVL